MAVKTEWEIDFTCGHTETRDLSHKSAGDRAGFAKWLAGTKCTECWQKDTPKRKKEYAKKAQAEDREQAQADAKKLGLPELEGSDKQVQWALTCRNNLIKDAHEALVMDESPQMTEDEFETKILEPARQVVRAGWWIDNREQDPQDLEELLTDVADDSVSENPF